MRNKNLKHICKSVYIKKGSLSNPLTHSFEEDEVLEIPISHSEGNYYAEKDGIKELEDNGQILFKYAFENPNGSIDDIAGITSKDYKIIGLMPHPERAMEDWSGSKDGKKIFDNLFTS